MEIIHTKTQEEFDRLMKYTEKNAEWFHSSKPTEWDVWKQNKEKTCVNTKDEGLDGGFSGIRWYEEVYPDIKIQTVDEYLNKVDPETERKYYVGEPVDLVWDEFATWDPFNKLKDKTMEIVKFAKNLTLSKNEKLMRKQGLKDENGIYTDAYTEIVDNIVYSEYEVRVLEIAKAKEADEK